MCCSRALCAAFFYQAVGLHLMADAFPSSHPFHCNRLLSKTNATSRTTPAQRLLSTASWGRVASPLLPKNLANSLALVHKDPTYSKVLSHIKFVPFLLPIAFYLLISVYTCAQILF